MLKKAMIIFGVLAVLVSSLAVVSAQGGAQGGRGGRGGGMPFGGAMPHDGMLRDGAVGDVMTDVTQAVMDATGLTLAEIAQELQAGKTISDIITEKGGDVEAVKAQVTETITTAINQAVTDGKITQERADTLLANLPTRIDSAMTSTKPVRDGMLGGGRDGRNGQIGALVTQLSTATGLSLAEIRTQISGGATIESLLTTANVTVEQFINDVIAPVETQLTADVVAGKMSQALADARLNLYRVQLQEIITGTAPVQANQ